MDQPTGTTPDPTRGPGLRGQSAARTAFRALGLVLAPLGVALVAVGFYQFATVEPSFDGPPSGLFLFAGGGFMTVIGFGCLNAGFLGTAARYGAGETMPVVKDSASYLTDGQGLLGVGRTVDDRSPAAATTGPFCRSCGTRNDEDARFCDGCGQSLA